MSNKSKKVLAALLLFFVMIFGETLSLFAHMSAALERVLCWCFPALPSLLPRVQEQFSSSAFGRVAFFVWTFVGHYLWVKFFDPLYPVGWERPLSSLRCYAQGLLSGFFLLVVPYVAFLSLKGVPFSFLWPPARALLTNVGGVLLLSFFTAFSEELIFRQYFLHRLKPWGLHVAVLLQAGLFGLIHYKAAGGGWGRVVSTGLGGLLLGYGRVYTNSLAYSVGMHSGIHLTTLLPKVMRLGVRVPFPSYNYIIDNNMHGLIGQVPMLLLALYFAYKAPPSASAPSSSPTDSHAPPF